MRRFQEILGDPAGQTQAARWVRINGSYFLAHGFDVRRHVSLDAALMCSWCFVKIFRTLPVLSRYELERAREKGVALALGNFDGVHIGHQAMMRRVCEAASDLDLIPSVLTFQPSPRDYFMKAQAPRKLLSLRAKLNQIARTGIERTYLLRFDGRLAQMSADIFADVFLAKTMRVGWLLISAEAKFGKGRQGNLAFLHGRKNAFVVEEMEAVMRHGQRVSSTAVREALSKNDIAEAASLLGRPYSIDGRVRRGDRRGRMMGFPTLNLVTALKPAITGVFAVRVRGLGAMRFGVANIGVRPTVAGSDALPTLEVHLFDFAEDVYGHYVEVEFIRRIRDEMRFPNVDTLVDQIRQDAQKARAILQVG